MRALLGLGLLAALPAAAADVDLFYPSGSLVHASGTLQGESPGLAGPGVSLGLLSWLAQDLAVAEFDDGSSEPLVGSLFALPLYGACTIGNKARIEALVPLYLYNDAPYGDFEGAGLGDVELRGMVPIWTSNEHFGISLRPGIGFPTGTEAAATKEGFSGSLLVATGGTIIPTIGWVGNVGFRGKAAETIETVTLGSTFDVLGGGWWEAQPGFRVGAEANVSVGLAKAEDTRRNTLFTAHGFAQVTAHNGLGLALGVGSGVGVGAPAWRVFAAFTWAPVVRDGDHDGVGDAEDQCPEDLEDHDEFSDDDGCPDLDNDGDGMPDNDDLCGLEAEDPDGYSDLDGCPDLDNDGDAVLDVDDACADLPGDAANHGCPDVDGDTVFDDIDECTDAKGPKETKGCPDGDADLVPDVRDQCLDEPGNVEADPRFASGCPALAFVKSDGTIAITQKITFDEGTSRIRSDGKPVLDEVAAILAAHPEIGLLEVGGHTDDSGTPEANLELSSARAEAVAVYLADHGIEAARLMPKGYGRAEPIDTNKTSAGRANNRRITFTIRRWRGGEGGSPLPPEDITPAEPDAPAEPETPIWH